MYTPRSVSRGNNNTRYSRHAREKAFPLLTESQQEDELDTGWPHFSLEACTRTRTRTHTRASARALTQRIGEEDRARRSLPVAAKSTRKLAVLDGTRPLVFTDHSEQNVSTSNFCQPLGRPLSTVVGTKEGRKGARSPESAFEWRDRPPPQGWGS